MPSYVIRYLDPELGELVLTPAQLQAAIQALTSLALTGGTINGVPIGGTTPAAVAATTLSATGATTLAALAVSGMEVLTSLGAALTAVGSTRTDALQLAAQANRVSTAGAGTGVILPAAVVGQHITVFNDGANAVQVYGAGTDTVDGHAAATGTPLTNTKRAIFFCFVAGAYESCQLGAVSA